jgi:hypothetical protein
MRLVRAAFALGFAMAIAACSLLIDKNAAQCQSSSDCPVGTYSVCKAGVCTDPRASALTACNSAPEAGVDFLNACSDASCVPFDNASRLDNLDDAGKLKPLP